MASLLMVLMLRDDVDFGGNPEDGDVMSLLWWLLVVFEEACWVFCCWVCRVYFSAAARTVFWLELDVSSKCCCLIVRFCTVA
jgi:hypothetical protein